MTAALLSLLVLACGPTTAKVGTDDIATVDNRGGTDAGATDAGATDAGATDAGATDAGGTSLGTEGLDTGGSTDGGSTDGGSTDGGSTDGGSTDGGSTSDLDSDGDGYSSSDGDCDDSDAEISPAGDEGSRPDGVDQDCTGMADDQLVCWRGVADYATIQEGIDAAPLDFVLRICPGVYNEDLEISQRVTLQSTDGPDVTRVVGTGSGPVLRISSVTQGPDGQDVGVHGLTLTGGVASKGGGLLAQQATIDIDDNIITDNQATRGGGLWLQTCTGIVSNNTISNNVAVEAGGLGVWGGRVEVADNIIQSNVATTTDETTYGAGSGGGGLLVYGDGPIQGNTIDGNESAYNGGGLFLLYGGGDVRGNTLTGNVSSEDGGGAYLNQATATVRDNTFVSNQAHDDAGGLRCYVCAITVSDNIFVSNVAADDAGGMKLSHSSNTISDNWFESNQAGDAGGGLELDNETSDVSNSTFVDNVATRGAGMHSWRSEGTLTLTDLYFQGNQASDCGGALQLDNDPWMVTAQRITAIDNVAVDGGAICTDSVEQDDGTIEDTRLVLSASLLAGNEAIDDGGGIYLRSAEVSLINVTLADNSAGSGALILKDGSVDLRNAVVSGTVGSAGIVVEGGNLSVAWSDLWDNEDGAVLGAPIPSRDDGNIQADPDYIDPSSGDYGLNAASVLIDVGDPDISDTDGTRSDLGHTGGPHAG